MINTFINKFKDYFQWHRCIILLIYEASVILIFHSLFEGLDNDIFISLGIHFVFSIFGLCIYVLIRKYLKLYLLKAISPKKLFLDSFLYLIFDFGLIHILPKIIQNHEIEIHYFELILLLIGVYLINNYFDKKMCNEIHCHNC